MEKLQYLILILCLLIAIRRHSPPCPRSPPPPPPLSPPPPPPPSSDFITSFTLSLQWPPSYCLMHNCRINIVPDTFTIHGLWPEGNFPRDEDGNCLGLALNPSAIFPLAERLQDSWPDLKSGNIRMEAFSFWSKEWNKHGKCCIPMFDGPKYFRTSLDLFDQLTVMQRLRVAGISQAQTLDAMTIRRAFPPGQAPTVHCNKKRPDLLHELQFCLDRQAEQYHDCQQVTKNCAPQFTLPAPPRVRNRRQVSGSNDPKSPIISMLIIAITLFLTFNSFLQC